MTSKHGTRQTYDQIAERYLERNRDRTRTRESMDLFAGYLQPGDRVLDIGCGPGFDSDLLQERGFRVTGIDLSSQMIEVGKRHFPGVFVQADMERLPFGEVADGLWVSASLLHIERPHVPPTLREFARVLKPGGVIFIAVKEGTGERWEYGPYDETVSRWFTYWDVDAFGAAVTDAGFRVLDLSSNGTWIKCCGRNRRHL